jgi:hypothetical protein
VWTGCIWLRIGPVAEPFEDGNGLSDSSKGEVYLYQLSDY